MQRNCFSTAPHMLHIMRNRFWRAAKNSTPAACAPQMSDDLLALFRKTGALLDGHPRSTGILPVGLAGVSPAGFLT